MCNQCDTLVLFVKANSTLQSHLPSMLDIQITVARQNAFYVTLYCHRLLFKVFLGRAGTVIQSKYERGKELRCLVL